MDVTNQLTVSSSCVYVTQFFTKFGSTLLRLILHSIQLTQAGGLQRKNGYPWKLQRFIKDAYSCLNWRGHKKRTPLGKQSAMQINLMHQVTLPSSLVYWITSIASIVFYFGGTACSIAVFVDTCFFSKQ